MEIVTPPVFTSPFMEVNLSFNIFLETPYCNTILNFFSIYDLYCKDRTTEGNSIDFAYWKNFFGCNCTVI